jgi:hypothetical protein
MSAINNQLPDAHATATITSISTTSISTTSTARANGNNKSKWQQQKQIVTTIVAHDRYSPVTTYAIVLVGLYDDDTENICAWYYSNFV